MATRRVDVCWLLCRSPVEQRSDSLLQETRRHRNPCLSKGIEWWRQTEQTGECDKNGLTDCQQRAKHVQEKLRTRFFEERPSHTQELSIRPTALIVQYTAVIFRCSR